MLLPGLLCAGKSTLVSLIQRLYDPTAGAVLLDGTDLRRAWEGVLTRVFVAQLSWCLLPQMQHESLCKCLLLDVSVASAAALQQPPNGVPFCLVCRQLDAAWFRRRVGVVSQDPRLFGLTVAENIAYGCPEATQVGQAAASRVQGRKVG